MHGIAGTGIGGIGQCLDLTSATGQGALGPMAFVTNNTKITFGTMTNFTISMWINPLSTLLTAGYARFFSLGTNGDTDRGTANTLQLLNNGAQLTGGAQTAAQAFVNTTQSSATAYGAINMPVSTWTYMALNYDGTNLSLYGGSTTTNVTLQARAAFAAGTVNIAGAFSLMLGNRISDYTRAFQGYLADVRFYTGSSTNMTNFLETVRESSSPPAPPTSVIALGCNNQAALSWSNSLGATGYIVKRGNSSGGETNYMAVGTNLTYTDTAVTISNTYYYEIAATNAVGPTPSSEAMVTIAGAGSLNLVYGPSNAVTCDNGTVTLSARATGPSVSYDWQYNPQGTGWIDLTGSSPTYSNYTSFALSASSDNGDLFRVVISNPCGAIIPPSAVITVNTGVTVTNEPVNQTTGTNWPATFTVGVSGSSVTYQWQKNSVNLTNGPNVSGATNATLILSNLTTNDSGANITCLVGNSCSAPAATSPPAVLTVLKNPMQMRVPIRGRDEHVQHDRLGGGCVAGLC